MKNAVIVGRWFTAKWRKRAAESGYDAAARQMRKQGIPEILVRLILFGKL